MQKENFTRTANRIALAAGALLVICLFGEALIGRTDLALAGPGQNSARAILTFFEIAASLGAVAWMGLMLWVALVGGIA